MNILGMGIDAIEVNKVVDIVNNESIHYMKSILLGKIVIGKYQPRKKNSITKDSINDLMQSIKESGVLQPIIVRDLGGEKYEVIAGERRFLAAIEAGLKEIPCVIKNVNEQDAYAIALIENIQREQLSLLEVSESLLKLKEEHFLSVEDVAKLVGKPRTTVANLIRTSLLLSFDGKNLWEKGDVDYGHVRAVIVLNHEDQNLVFQYVVKNNLSVRETERFVREQKYINFSKAISTEDALEKNITAEEMINISTRFYSIYKKNIKIKELRSGKIRIAIEFENLEKTYQYLNEKY